MKINEDNYEVFKKLEDKGFDIKITWTDAENIEGLMFTDDMFDLIQDMAVEIGNLEEEIEDTKKDCKEQIEDLEQDIRDNYRPIPRRQQECWEDRG